MGTTTIFCASDECCKEFEPRWEQHLLESSLERRRQGALCLSEVMTIMVGFHLSGYRTFKYDYLNDVLRYQRGYFPGLVSCHRFVELLQGSLVPLCCFPTSRFGRCSGISFIDSTKISVCHNYRIQQHKVMAELLSGERPVWIGFMGSSCTQPSMMKGNC